MPGRKHTITVVAFEGVQLLDVTGPVEVFTTANQYGADYDVRIVSPTGLGVRTSSGVTIGVDGMQAGFPRDRTRWWCRAGRTGGPLLPTPP